jgi:hypothetical protein
MRRRLVIGTLIAITWLGGCGKKSPTGPSGQGLPGTWRATRAEFVSRANSSVRVEIVSKGATMTLVLDAARTYTTTVTNPGQPPDVVSGTWSSSTDVLTLKQTGRSGDSQFDMNLSGDTLTLNGGSALFAFDTVFEEAVLNATFVRQ